MSEEITYADKIMFSYYENDLERGYTKQQALEDAAEMVHGGDFKAGGIKRLKYLLTLDIKKLKYTPPKVIHVPKSTCLRCKKKFNNSILFAELYCDDCRGKL